jgi:carbon monoxide dehydrogenase subunit G
MAGAVLEEIGSDGSFLGSVKVAVGPISMSYKGRVQFTNVDEASYRVELTAEGREGSGGTARGTMSSAMLATADGQTEVTVDVAVDVAGRIVQLGRGLMQDVAGDMFGQFVVCVKQQLEGAGSESASEARPESEAHPEDVKAVPVVPLVFRSLWRSILRLLRRILRRPPPS